MNNKVIKTKNDSNRKINYCQIFGKNKPIDLHYL